MQGDAGPIRHEDVRGLDLRDAFEHRQWSRHVAQRAVERGRLGIEAPALVGVGEQGLNLGGEPQLALCLDPEERLFSGAVARQDEALTSIVPDGEAEHAFEPRYTVGTEPLVQGDDGLDVARRAERIAGPDARVAQLARVVDLAVTDHPDGAVGILKRLVAGGEVHDGQAAGAETGALVAHDAFAVGTAVRERGRHGRDAVGVLERSAGEGDGAEDAAHYRPLPRPRGGGGGWEGGETVRGRQGPYAA